MKCRFRRTQAVASITDRAQPNFGTIARKGGRALGQACGSRAARTSQRVFSDARSIRPAHQERSSGPARLFLIAHLASLLRRRIFLFNHTARSQARARPPDRRGQTPRCRPPFDADWRSNAMGWKHMTTGRSGPRGRTSPTNPMLRASSSRSWSRPWWQTRTFPYCLCRKSIRRISKTKLRKKSRGKSGVACLAVGLTDFNPSVQRSGASGCCRRRFESAETRGACRSSDYSSDTA